MKNLLLPALAALLVTGCSGSFFEDLNTNNLDPVKSVPKAESYAVEHGITLSWEADPGADLYVLTRDTDPAGNFGTTAYQGKALSFTDMKVLDDQFYYYRLAKMRGQKLFPASSPVMARTGSIRKDKYEPNEDKEHAVTLEDITEANIYYAQDGLGYTLEDRDWYKVTLSSRKQMGIKIDGLDTGNLNNEDISINIEGGQTAAVSNGNEFTIYNYDYTDKTLYFQISVNKNQILGSPTDPGAKIGGYRINIIQINNIKPAG